MNVKKRELLVYGYIKEHQNVLSLSYDVPECITNIIVFHYPLDFTFQRDIKGMNVSEDGLKVTSTEEGQYATIRFGEFLYFTDNVKLDVTFKLTKVSPRISAVGFMTPEYTTPEKARTGYNYGENHTMWLDGDGYFVTTIEDFLSEYKHQTTIQKFKSFWNGNGDKVHAQIDTIEKKGRIWNDSDTNKDKVFQINLLRPTAILIDCGQTGLEIEVVSQEFTYGASKSK